MECVQVLVDTSENTAPRGFPDFDKDQLDPVRREYMKKLRIEMLDYNEEYLSKHPQVEALMRLIVMEVVCHKPYDVRNFIKELLMSDNLETRVAKIILSKRINVDRSHTREYFRRVAEYEYKSGPGENAAMERSEWPEPRPKRPVAKKDKPGYSHLHYFKDPYWLYPSEFMTVCKKDGHKEKNEEVPKLPKWASEFLKVNFFTKWGDAFYDGLQPKSAKGTRKHRKCESRSIRELMKKTRESKKDTEKTSESRASQKTAFFKRFGGDIREINKAQILNCSSCKAALMENRSRSVGKDKSQSSSMLRQTKFEFENMVEDLEEEWGCAEKLRVLRGDPDGKTPLRNGRGEGFATVTAQLGEAEGVLVPVRSSGAHTSSIQRTGEEITFVVPESVLLIEPENIGPRNFNALDEEVPIKYRLPLSQIILPKKE